MSTVDTASGLTAIDGLLTEAAASGAVPGVAVVVSGRDRVLYEGAAGRLRAHDPDAPPVGADTLFRMASMTKAMTSVATLQLVEDGLLTLDTAVRDVLPEFGELRVLEGFDGETPRLRAPARPPVIRDLLTHTSGCGYFFCSEDLARWHALTGVPHVLTGLRQGVMAPLVRDPGVAWEYGVSTDWLGLVVEGLRGAPLDAVLQERLFGPLGMQDATFRPTTAQRERLMDVHQRGADGTLGPSRLDLPREPELASGGGGSYATARDHARFLRALLRGGELDGARVLRPETVELMFTDHLDGIPLPDVIRTTAPELSNDIPSLPGAQGWGLGLHLTLERIPGMRAAGSGDWAGLFNSYYWIDRDTGISAALITQVLPFFDEQVVPLLLSVEAAVYAALDG